MSEQLTRRQAIKLLVSGTAAAEAWPRLCGAKPSQSVRVGMVGVGHRGYALLRVLLSLEAVEVTALADIQPSHLKRAQDYVEKQTGKRPQAYGDGPEDFRRLVTRDDLGAVITATPWKWHVPVMVAAMKAGKYAATEVPAADTLEGCWELVNSSEETGMPCMILENVCYFREMMLVLRLVRAGLLGEIIHGEGGYQHDLRMISDSGADNFAPGGALTWRGEELARRNGNLYPTHPLGPLAQYMNINRGDAFDYLVSMSSKSRGMKTWVRKNFGPDHPNARREFAMGDVNTTLIRTQNGCTITLYHDTQLPRPYDLIVRVQGTEGIYQMTVNGIYLEGRSAKKDEWEPLEKYRQQYEHPLWQQYGGTAQRHGHGGSDYLTLLQFIEAVRYQTPVPLDVYDAAAWSVITPLSEISVARDSSPVKIPDFTRGKWRDRQPVAHL